MPKRTGRVKDKWREKKWVVVESPTPFANTPVAYVPITDPAKAIGRVIEVILYDLLKQDPNQYAKKLYFVITSIADGKASTIFKGMEYSREHIRSLVRKGSSMVSYINDYITKDGFKVRAYFTAFTSRRTNASKKHLLRGVAEEVMASKAAQLNYGEFVQEVVLDKIASDIYNETKKICHLRSAMIRKTKLLGMPATQPQLQGERELIQEAVAAEGGSGKTTDVTS